MSEFTINDHKYKTARLDAMIQWAVARRLAPVVAKTMSPEVLKKAFALLPKLKQVSDASKSQDGLDPADKDFGEFLEIAMGLLHPFMDAVAAMPEADNEFVISTCLAAASREQPGGGWAQVKPNNSAIMFKDIDMVEMLQIVLRVVIENLASFSFASLLSLGAPKTAG